MSRIFDVDDAALVRLLTELDANDARGSLEPGRSGALTFAIESVLLLCEIARRIAEACADPTERNAVDVRIQSGRS